MTYNFHSCTCIHYRSGFSNESLASYMGKQTAFVDNRSGTFVATDKIQKRRSIHFCLSISIDVDFKTLFKKSYFVCRFNRLNPKTDKMAMPIL